MSMGKFVVLEASLLLLAMFANAASRNNTMRITVLNSETRSLSLDDNNGVPLNCEQLTFDAYCRSTRTAPLVNTLLVQDGNDAPFRISCTAESRFSRCVPLPKGESFDARREKKGVMVYYPDDKGKLRSQLYTLVAETAKAKVAPASGGATATSAPASVSEKPTATPAAASGESSSKPAPAQSATPVPVGSAVRAGEGTTASAGHKETVKCSFASTPAGAEVTVDGRYVGSTPSVLGLATGTHVIVVSMDGYSEWKRELAVTAGSELTVNAVLEKKQ